MSDLSNYISFDVMFDETAQAPRLVLTDTGSYPSPASTSRQGYFRITTPDRATRNYSLTSADTDQAGHIYNFPLPLATDGTVQQGVYSITFHVVAATFQDTDLTRAFSFSFTPVQTAIAPTVDLSEPSISYSDNTSYTAVGYNAPSVSRAWKAFSAPTGTFTGTSPTFDLSHSGNIYDAAYQVNLVSTATYVSSTYSWLSVKYAYSIQDTANSRPITTFAQMLSWVLPLDGQARGFNYWESRDHLKYLHSMAKINLIKHLACEGMYTGIQDHINELYRLTHNGVAYNPVRTNSVIPAGSVDLCGCSNSNVTTPAMQITVQPQGSTIDEGANFTLSITTTGGGTKTYQWKKGGTDISGATASTYTKSNAATGDSGSYTVVVSDGTTTLTSSAAVMVVNALSNPLAITTQPQSQTVSFGTAANFSVVASGGTTPYSYQWSFGGGNYGTSTPNLTIPAQDLQVGGPFTVYVIVTDHVGASLHSTNVGVTVTAAQLATPEPAHDNVTSGGFRESWSAIANATGYLAQVYATSDFSGSPIYSNTITDVFVTIAGQAASTQYYFRVFAIDSTGTYGDSAAGTDTVTTSATAITGHYNISSTRPTTTGGITSGYDITLTHNANATINWPFQTNPMIYWFAKPNTETAFTKSNDGTSDDTIGAGHSWNHVAVGSYDLYYTESVADSLVTTIFKIS